MKLLGSRMRLSNDTETNGWQGINMCQYLFLLDFAKSNSNTEVIIFKSFFFSLCMYMFLWMGCECGCSCHRGQKGASGTLEQELEAVESHLMWGLGMKVLSSLSPFYKVIVILI